MSHVTRSIISIAAHSVAGKVMQFSYETIKLTKKKAETQIFFSFAIAVELRIIQVSQRAMYVYQENSQVY